MGINRDIGGMEAVWLRVKVKGLSTESMQSGRTETRGKDQGFLRGNRKSEHDIVVEGGIGEGLGVREERIWISWIWCWWPRKAVRGGCGGRPNWHNALLLIAYTLQPSQHRQRRFLRPVPRAGILELSFSGKWQTKTKPIPMKWQPQKSNT